VSVHMSQRLARLDSWAVPSNVSGKVTATVSIDASPFAWKAEDLVLEVK